jgi:hypothetical protein
MRSYVEQPDEELPAKVDGRAHAQRKRELLAAYAGSPLGEYQTAFCKRMHVSSVTWIRWRTTDPDFSAAYERIQAARRRIDLEPFDRYLNAAAEAQGRKAAEGDNSSARTLFEVLGLLPRGGGQTVQVNTVLGGDGRGQAIEGSEEEVAKLVERRNAMRDLILRIAARAVVAEDAAGDPRPAPDGRPAAE